MIAKRRNKLKDKRKKNKKTLFYLHQIVEELIFEKLTETTSTKWHGMSLPPSSQKTLQEKKVFTMNLFATESLFIANKIIYDEKLYSSLIIKYLR